MAGRFHIGLTLALLLLLLLLLLLVGRRFACGSRRSCWCRSLTSSVNGLPELSVSLVFVVEGV